MAISEEQPRAIRNHYSTKGDIDRELAAILESEFYRADTELSFYEFLRSHNVTEVRIRDLFPGVEIAQSGDLTPEE